MGSSSKKHKSDKKQKHSRSPEREREKHRHHKRHKSHRQRLEDIETISSSDSDVEEIGVILPFKPPTPPPPPSISVEDSPPRSSAGVGDGKSHESLSIEETNALRARLGLAPLKIDSKSNEEPKPKREDPNEVDMGEFVHKPAKNISEKNKTDKIRQRLTEKKEKRKIEEKLKSVRGLGESDSEDDASNWVKKSREKQRQQQEAKKRAKMLDDLDDEFGIGALVEEERRTTRKDLYSAKDLRGLKVAHKIDGFMEGSNLILTLKDKGVLEEDDDTLINVNMVDNERYLKNVERKKKKPGAWETDMDVDDPLNPRARDVLTKYDEEIDGEKEDSFILGNEMSAAEKARQRMQVKKNLSFKSKVDLASSLRLASDYYTEDEAAAKFKKPGKKGRKIRKKAKPLKADDLMPKEEVVWPSQDLGSRRSGARVKAYPTDDDMDLVKREQELDIDDVPPVPEDLSDVKLEPDDAELELQLALNKARKLKQKEVHENPVEKMAKEIIESGSGYNLEGPDGSIVLNSTAEFCRTLGDIPTYGLSGNREEEEELLDFEREMKEEAKRNEEERRNRGAWSQVELDEKIADVVPSDVAILDEEPDVGKGVAGALRLAVSKGYLEKETINRPSASRLAHLQAQNYSIDDKAHGDDEKFGRRDRYMGPTSDFKEKDNYKPNVKLDYIDDDGRLLNAKEAFRYLSHKFHGKGPGKNKVEKRMKKNEQEGLMKQMSSTDTPLRTLTMLQQKQKETQSPFVVLSGNKQAHGSATISKMKLN